MDMVSYLLAKNASGGGVTMEEVLQITGELEDLDTTDKSNLVSAINELAVNDIPTIDFTDAEQVLQMIDDATIEDKSGIFVYATNIGEDMDYNTYAYIEILSEVSGKAYYGSNVASFSIETDDETGDNIIVYEEVETMATREYVDDAIASAGGSDVPIYILNTTNQMADNNGSFNLSNDEKADYSAIITDAYAKGYKHIAIMLCSTTSGKSYMFYSNSVITNTTWPTFYADATFNDRTNMDYIVRRSLSGFGTWNNDEFTVTGLLNCDVERRLIVHSINSVAYTPTPNSYNPATTKYVDDAISTEIGNINTILATLTTPSNGGA